jgi:hypothetical protein
VVTSGPTDALVFGGTGAPVGMFLITGSGWKLALFFVESMLPMLIGPWMLSPLKTKDTLDDGCVQSDPWKI